MSGIAFRASYSKMKMSCTVLYCIINVYSRILSIILSLVRRPSGILCKIIWSFSVFAFRFFIIGFRASSESS